MLSPASLTLKFDAILDVPEGDEALTPIVEEIVVESPSSGASTLIASPATTGHAEIAPSVPQVTVRHLFARIWYHQFWRSN
ncbi:hypothetical protein FRC11_000243 [Ceratobasidium sp. 423]|nr:hypothetical protein FRC11_000243 [Ceratobasidium sp. 423]